MKSGTGNSIGKYLLRIPMLLTFLLLSASVFSQQTGVVEGRLTNRTDPAIVPGGVPLEVLSLSGGMGIIRMLETDAAGKFRIENLPLQSMLMLRAIYRDANYNKQFQFDDAGYAFIELDVFETTESTNDIRLEGFQMVFQATGSHLQAQDTVTFVNETTPLSTFMHPEGNFRFSKAKAIETLPQMRITAPGSSMPVLQSALESPDGQMYYCLYPLRPGRTLVEILQMLPYEDRNYTYIKKFYHPVSSIEIVVSPVDMELSGTGLTKMSTYPENNMAVYQSAPIEAGAEVEWVFSGGTPVVEQASSPSTAGSRIQSVPNAVGRNSGIIGSLLLMGFVLILWYAFNRTDNDL